jgi:hypothetical protein
MKKATLLLFYCLCAYSLTAQITTDETPFGFDIGISKSLGDVPLQLLSAPDMVQIETEDEVNDTRPGPLRFAYPVPVNYTLTNSGIWQTLEDSSRLWRLKVRLPGAISTHALYDKFWLPKGAKFFVYSEETKQYIGAVTSEFLEGDSINPVAFSTGLIYGETVTFEYHQPAGIRDSAIISISRIDYGYRFIDNPYEIQTRGFGDAGDCQVNINCEEGQNWQNEKRAVARVSIPLSYGSGWCSCALVNNTGNDNTPYVLTADHCLQDEYGNYLFDAIDNNNASQWIFYWAYEHYGCNNSGEPFTRSTTGATVTANNDVSDFALLRLTQDPRILSGFTPYYLGWDRSGNSGTGGVGIHHPMGDVKKISTYSITPFNSYCANSNLYWDINFISTPNGHSVMQPGSSGSPLINTNRHIIGQLYGPYDVDRCPAYQCDNPSGQQVAYGKFNVSWTGNGALDNRRRLHDWLDPFGTAPTTLSGLAGPYISDLTAVCPGGTAFSVNNPPTGATITWNQSSNITRVSSQGSNPCIFSPASTGSGWIEAIINSSSDTITLPRKNVGVGIPNAPNNITRFPSNGKKFAIDSYYEFYVGLQPGATYFTWNVSGGTIVEGQGTSFILVRTVSYPTNFSLSVKAGNDCGESSYFTRTGYVVDEDLPIDAIPPDETFAEIDTPENNLIELKQGLIPAAYTISIAPNPATGETTLTIETAFEEKPFDETAKWDLEIYSPMQALKTKKTRLKGKSTTIQTAGWTEGVYTVHVKYQDEILTGKLVVKR